MVVMLKLKKFTEDYTQVEREDIFNDRYTTHYTTYNSNLSYEIRNTGAYTVANAPISTLYNCHAYSLYYKGYINDINTNTSVWISNPTIYFQESIPSLVEVLINDVIATDIVFYINYNNTSNIYIHSGIVKTVPSSNKSFENIIVVSKDGDGALVEHEVSNEYSYYNSDIVVKFYRWNHSYEYESVSFLQHEKLCVVGLESITEAHNFIEKVGKRICLECGFNSKFEPIYPNGTLLYRYIADESDTYRTYVDMLSYLLLNTNIDIVNEFIIFDYKVQNNIDLFISENEVM